MKAIFCLIALGSVLMLSVGCAGDDDAEVSNKPPPADAVPNSPAAKPLDAAN
jgi:hypothetical protein